MLQIEFNWYYIISITGRLEVLERLTDIKVRRYERLHKFCQKEKDRKNILYMTHGQTHGHINMALCDLLSVKVGFKKILQ